MALDEFARLRGMLQRRAATMPRQPDADALAALERCRQCHYTKLCDEFLAAQAPTGTATFCANAHYAATRRRLP